MENYLRGKAEALEKKIGALSLEPHVVVIGTVGEKLSQMPTYAVIGPKLYYQVDSIPLAIDIVLKSAFVFDINYPKAARSAWTFVQRAIYGINAKDDVVSNRTQELLSEMH